MGAYKGSRHDEFEEKRQQTGSRDGREARFVYIDQDGNEVPKDENKIHDLVKSGKLKEQKLFRVHEADKKDFLNRRQ